MQVQRMLYAAAVALVCQGANAQTQTPGLWEHSFKVGADRISASSVKVCVTPEEAAKPLEARLNAGNCTQKDIQRTGNTVKFKYECIQPPSTGEGEMTVISDKAYSGKTLVTSQRNGKTSQMTMEMQGKWLAADCGDVKPRKPPPAK